jgi:WD40 repeat protein
MATKGEPANVRTWDVGANKEVRVFAFEGQIERRETRANGAVLNVDGTRVAWMSLGGREVQIADTTKGRRIATLPMESSDWPRGGMAFSPDGQRLAVGVLRSEGAAMLGALFFPGKITSHYLFEEMAGKFIGVYEVSAGKQLFTLPGHEGFVEELAFSPDGRRLVAVGGTGFPWRVSKGRPPSGEITVWDAAGPGTSLLLQTSVKNCGPLAFSSDGQRLLLVENPKPIWDAKTQRMVTPKNDLASAQSPEVWDVSTGLRAADAATWDRLPTERGAPTNGATWSWTTRKARVG